MLTPPPGIRGLIFDWDGTLVDSHLANYRAMAQALHPYGISLDKAWFDARTGLSSAEMVGELLRETPLSHSVPITEVVRQRDELFLQSCHQVKVVPGVALVARSYYGRLPIAVASGGARRVIEATLPHVQLAGAIDVLVTREDVQQGKPSPDLFLLAARQLHIEPAQCLVYEDSSEGLLAASRAGMTAIDVRPYRNAAGTSR